MLMVLCPGALLAAGGKTAGNISIVDDLIGAPAGSVDAAGGIYSAQGFIGAVDNGQHSNSPVFVESGFYSMLVTSPSSFDFNSVATGSVNTQWSAANPAGALYQSFTSTANIEAYFQLLGTTDYLQLVGGLALNTSYYNFLMANYMESDYAPYISTLAVTLSAPVSAGAFVLKDVGPGPVELAFTSENPGPSLLAAWTASTPNLPAPNYGLASSVYGSYIYISGGNDGVKFSSAVYSARLNPDGSLNSWAPAGYMPAARYGHQMFAARGRLYVLGGFNAGSAQSTVWSAQVSSSGALGAWAQETSLPVALYFHCAVYYLGNVYVSGGYSSSVSAAVYKAGLGEDGTLGAWTALTNPMPGARYAHTMNESNGVLYVTGGNDGSGPKNTVWSALIKDDGTIDPWYAQASLPSVRFAHKAVVLGDKLLALGGDNGTGPQNMVWQASVPANGGIYAWTPAAPLPELSRFHAAEPVGEKIYILGGHNGSAAGSNMYSADFTGTQYQVQASTDAAFASVSEQSAWSSDNRWKFRALAPNTAYYFRAKARNWAQVETAFSAEIATVTYAALPSTAAWSAVYISSGTANWLAGENLPGTLYQCEISSYADYAPVSFSSATVNLYAYFDGLLPGTTYYARVKALNSAGVAARLVQLPSATTLLDPALDTSSPTITDNQSGDDAWRSANTSVYDVDFADAGGAGLLKFQVRAATAAGGAGVVADWLDVSTALAGTSYTENWALPQSVWDALSEGPTNYISVRVFDTVANSSQAVDAFYVLKDTTPPAVAVDYTAPGDWISEDPGPVSTTTFSDYTSKLAQARYSVSTNKLSGNANVIGWTDIADPAASAVYATTWSYNFSQLVNGASNYFSLKARDAAGNEKILYDAFVIKKSMLGPVVTITSPSDVDIYLSTITQITGSAIETASHPVIGTEISALDSAAARYWDGADFTAPTRVWHTASGTQAWSLAVGLPLVNGRLYEIVARSSDTIGYSSAYSTRPFTYDTGAPSAAVTAPADGTNVYSPVSISGTAADGVSGVNAVELRLSGVSDGKYWDGVSAWAVAQTSIAAGTGASWTYNFSEILAASLGQGGTYYCAVRAADKAYPANWGSFGGGSTFVYYDTTPPGAPGSLSAVTGSLPGTAVLSWISPGDNGSGGYLLLKSSFMVQASTWSGADFSTATPGNLTISTAAIAAGSTQSYTLSGLAAGTVYYFAAWAADDAMNWSPVSTASAVSGAANTGSISGTVTQASSQSIAGIIVEAYDGNDFVRAGDNTAIDGTYELSGLDLGKYTVKATWSANDITSSVSKSDIAAGAGGVNFSLSIAYELASISGYIPAGFNPRARVAARAAASARFRPSGTDGEMPYVELFQKGRRVAAAPVDSGGRFHISNLLPGTYSIRVFNGREFTELSVVKLKEGENLNFTPQWSILSKEAVYAYPNPARTGITLHFETNLFNHPDFEAEVSVFNIAGGLVKTFRDAEVGPDNVVAGPGNYAVVWNFSKDKVASGVYLYMVSLKNISTGKVEKAVKKLAIIR